MLLARARKPRFPLACRQVDEKFCELNPLEMEEIGSESERNDMEREE